MSTDLKRGDIVNVDTTNADGSILSVDCEGKILRVSKEQCLVELDEGALIIHKQRLTKIGHRPLPKSTNYDIAAIQRWADNRSKL